MTKMGGTQYGKNGWNWCHINRGKNGWSSQWQKWVEVIMAKMGEVVFRDTVAKMGGAHCGKNGWSSHGKNGWSLPWQKWVELVLEKL